MQHTKIIEQNSIGERYFYIFYVQKAFRKIENVENKTVIDD